MMLVRWLRSMAVAAVMPLLKLKTRAQLARYLVRNSHENSRLTWIFLGFRLVGLIRTYRDYLWSGNLVACLKVRQEMSENFPPQIFPSPMVLLEKCILKGFDSSQHDRCIKDIISQRQSSLIRMYSEDDVNQNFEGKRVAVVGPCKTSWSLGEEINDFDIVVRVNFSLKKVMPAEKYGSKTDVIFFNGAVSRHSTDLIEIALARGIHVFSKCSNVARRYACGWAGNHDALVFGGENALQWCLLHVLRLSPSEIKLFAFDFYTAGNSYDRSYRSQNSDFSEKNMARSILNHDPLSNYLLARQLYQSKCFTGCPLVDKSLSMTQDEVLSAFKSYVSY